MSATPVPPLSPPDGPITTDGLLAQFLDYAAAKGLTLYAAQEEAILELFEGRHVLLSTPTGSGKSLVALALHFKHLCEGRTSYYTSPIKALVNEKFFALCEVFGPERVGMLTGDASINRDAPVICCTAEILANLSLRQGDSAKVDAVVMDEFHYYADRDRGVAWQIPLLTLPNAQFLLMSATLGDTTAIEQKLQARTKRTIAAVRHVTRPVPLDFEYRLTPLHETIADLVASARAPVYLVNFTQRAAAEEAQNLMSVNLLSKDEKEAMRVALHGFRFDSPYGKELQRFLRHGVGIHHAGLLPKYRRLVERLAQSNQLRVICGTDTLGVGVNIPLRTVLFSQLCKFDGEKVGILPVRDFHQISGRAGRKGFDDRGWVVAQAPEHVIENLALERKAAAGKKVVKRKPPEKGYVHFDELTFQRLQERTPEALENRFEVTHSMVLALLQREGLDHSRGGGYRALLELVGLSHASDWDKRRHRKHAAVLLRSLRHAGIVNVVPNVEAWPQRRAGSKLEVAKNLQRDFSMNHTLSLYLVDTLAKLDPALGTWVLDVLTLVESILESPKVVLQAQVFKAKGEKVAELKAQGMEYDQRMEELEKVEHPKPNAEFIYQTFNAFSDLHPWVGKENIRPKSIARELYETGATFDDYVREYGLERSEGVLLRYLTDAWRTLQQSVPESFRTDELVDVLAFLRLTVGSVDSSLLEEWEHMRDPEAIVAQVQKAPVPVRKVALDADPRAFTARVRHELHRFAQALSRKRWDDAVRYLYDPASQWTPALLDEAVAPIFANHGGLDWTPRARLAGLTRVENLAPNTYRAEHKLLGQDGDDTWYVETTIDLTRERGEEDPLIELVKIAS